MRTSDLLGPIFEDRERDDDIERLRSIGRRNRPMKSRAQQYEKEKQEIARAVKHGADGNTRSGHCQRRGTNEEISDGDLQTLDPAVKFD